jgi:tetratricopeptide (TPR) repeat protein
LRINWNPLTESLAVLRRARKQKAGRNADAVAAYARAMLAAPDYEAPAFNLGVLQLRQKDPAAIETFTKIIEKHPESADAHKSRGQAYASQKKLAEALVDFEKAASLAPVDGQVWLIVGQLRESQKKDDAGAAYCKAAELGVEAAKKRCKTE